MRLLPVLDLLNGVVVRGVAGQRESYRPVQSRIVDSSVPLAVARAFREHIGLDTLYVADLDAILHGRPNFDVYQQLADDGFTIWVDAGVKDAPATESVFQAGADTVIAGLESTTSPELLSQLIATFGPARILFSLDLKQGRPLTNAAAWGGPTSQSIKIVEQTLDCGVRRLIVLDLAQVGVGLGISTLPLCRQIQDRAHDKAVGKLELITGGGVRNINDLELLVRSGLDGTLIASALHNGQIQKNDVEQIQCLSRIIA